MIFDDDNPDPQNERYEKFVAEGIYWEREIEKEKKKNHLLRKISDNVYTNFYNDSSNIWQGLAEDIDAKSKVLQKYFPKFRDNGNVPVRDMEPAQIGRLFLKMLNYSKKRINQ